MTHDKTGGPAFPQHSVTLSDDGVTLHESVKGGMTFRDYAAIELRVPDSGTEWLDDMIRQAKRDEFAGQALAGLRLVSDADAHWMEQNGARNIYRIADAMLKQREEK